MMVMIMMVIMVMILVIMVIYSWPLSALRVCLGHDRSLIFSDQLKILIGFIKSWRVSADFFVDKLVFRAWNP